MLYLWIAVASAIGGVARFALGSQVSRMVHSPFPWGTLLVNIVGCSFIGWFAAATATTGRYPMSLQERQIVMAGFCGGFTTFSAFSLETLTLLRDGYTIRAALYVAISVACCLAGVWLGHSAAQRFTGS